VLEAQRKLYYAETSVKELVLANVWKAASFSPGHLCLPLPLSGIVYSVITKFQMFKHIYPKPGTIKQARHHFMFFIGDHRKQLFDLPTLNTCGNLYWG
jgi:hypothetical protein